MKKALESGKRTSNVHFKPFFGQDFPLLAEAAYLKNRRGRPNKLRHGKPDPVFLEPPFCEECGARLIHAPLNNDDELVCPVCGLVNKEEDVEREDE